MTNAKTTSKIHVGTNGATPATNGTGPHHDDDQTTVTIILAGIEIPAGMSKIEIQKFMAGNADLWRDLTDEQLEIGILDVGDIHKIPLTWLRSVWRKAVVESRPKRDTLPMPAPTSELAPIMIAGVEIPRGLTRLKLKNWLKQHATDFSRLSGDELDEAAAEINDQLDLPETWLNDEWIVIVKRSRPKPAVLPTPAPTPTLEPINVESEHLTDLGNGLRMARLHGDSIRWTEAHGWLLWDSQRWQRDSTRDVERLAKRTALSFYTEAAALLEQVKQAATQAAQAAEAGDEKTRDAALKHQNKLIVQSERLQKWAYKCESRDKISAMIAMAQSEFPIPVRPETLDTNGWLFNVQNGTIDLRTGLLQPHQRSDLITKISPVVYDELAVCPGWLAFLAKIFANDQDLIGFLQRAIGMSLTGIVYDHHLLFAHGAGQNGKSTFFSVITRLLGEYFMKCPTETLMIRDRGPGIPNDVARMAGARMILAAEVNEGQRLDEGRVKDLTGGDTLTARFLNKEFFDFDPSHKLWMYGNHKPVIRGTDTGIWRRILLIPFLVTIPEKERDSKLKERLINEELSGIFKWALDGCLEWQKTGLNPPQSVTDATKEYRDDSDILAAFLNECTTTEPFDNNPPMCQASHLYDVYKRWSSKGGMSPVSLTRFGGQIRERGIERTEDKSTRRNFYQGIGILQEWLKDDESDDKANKRHYLD